MAINENEEVFIRADLDKTSTGNTAFYRLSAEMVEFLNTLETKVGLIEGVVLERKSEGEIGFNIGFVCGKDKQIKK